MRLEEAVAVIQRSREAALPGSTRPNAADLNCALDRLLELARATIEQEQAAAADTPALEAAGDPEPGEEPGDAAPAPEPADENESADTEVEPAPKAPTRSRRPGEYCRDCTSALEVALISKRDGETQVQTSQSIRCQRDGQRRRWSDWCESFAWPSLAATRCTSGAIEIH